MSRVCKKIIHLLGLALIAGITTTSAGILPTQQVSATSSDTTVQFKVIDGNFMAQIIAPIDGTTLYSEEGVTTRISFSKAQSIDVYLTFPDGHQVLVETVVPLDDDDGEFTSALPVDKYGDYIITVKGTDLSGSTVHGDTKAFSYRAVTAEENKDNGKIEVKYGTNICRLGFQVYKASDTEKKNPLLDPEYIIDGEQTGQVPNIIDVEIPGFETLGPDEFTVVVTGYDCLNDDAIDSDDVNMNGVLQPPKTGAISILGITVSQEDYLVSGAIVFVLATGFALFLLGRRKKTRQ